MRPGVDNSFIWVTVVAMRPIEQPGRPESAKLRFTGVIEHQVRRGMIEETETTHVPIEARGRLALSLVTKLRIGSSLWVIGEHREDIYLDRYNEEQHKLKILVNSYEMDSKADWRMLFKS